MDGLGQWGELSQFMPITNMRALGAEMMTLGSTLQAGSGLLHGCDSIAYHQGSLSLMLAGSQFWKLEMEFSLMSSFLFSALTAMALAMGGTTLEPLDLVAEVSEIKGNIDDNNLFC